ncbi:unnamed protein product [Durusdinium trenchii]|uniref:Uncharacterized protein n=1 Tax=Durusdinium trenchii TaxID=1381693 RepID=A0ABP0S376_9DINO
MPMFVATLFFLARLTYAANAECDEESLLQVKSEKVVVVSGCMSESNNSITEDMCTLAKQNFQEYTDYHGYKLVFFTQTPPGAEDRPPHWSKVLALLNVLEYEPEVDYVFWTDSDSLFVNQTISLMNYAPRGSSSMTFSGDYLCYFNSGHMLFKNDQWTRQFLKEVWDTYPSPYPWQDQSAMIYVMHKFSASKAAKKKAETCRDHLPDLAGDPEGCCNPKLVTGVDMRPKDELNALNYYKDGVPKTGLFIVHFAGRDAAYKTKTMRDTMQLVYHG